ncbi:hypothetical protein N7489_011660 [Penicillium chrysogenum]|uniref:uncharacterized protein n=1 Tax=Penicillium chrysogenum TaxID=5076 RepID=UPI0024DF14F2|nr:uncharacterized protein N7489_011660 [Penicillium chrysogenum]KAJ5230952.1 hypothetical protein N7489_011660 [Penicillium chrysogenum]
MPQQRKPVALQSPFPLSNVHRDRQHPTQRVEGIVRSIYAEMSRLQHEHKEAILLLHNHGNMLRALADEKASLEEQNKSLFEHITILQGENCALELKNNKLKSELAKKRLQYPEQPDGKQA